MRSFAEVADAWLAEVRARLRPKTLAAYSIATRHFLAAIPEARIRFATRQDLLHFRDARAVQASPASANRDVKAIKACLAWAELDGLHPPVKGRRLLLPEPPKRDRTLSAQEVARVLDAASVNPRALAVLKVAHATGFRLGEILNLTWADVDFTEGTVTVTAKPGWQPKTRAALRTVYAPELVRWLESWRAVLRHREPGDFVCPMDTRTGRGWTHRVHDVLREVYDRAGVKGRAPTHALRHTLASDLVQSGVPIHVAQKALGHASPAVTLGIYAHAQRAGLKEAAEALARLRRG